MMIKGLVTQMGKSNYTQNRKISFKICLIILMLITFLDFKGLATDSFADKEVHQTGFTNYEKNYNSIEYLYSLKIPDGFLGESDPPPSPNHGCRINLSKTPESYIWATGNYNSTDSLSPADELMRMMDSRIKDGMEIRVLKRTSCSLGSLSGERLVINFRNVETEKVSGSKVEDKVVAFRSIKGYGEIIYTVGLVTNSLRYENDKKIFELVLKSWKTENP